MPPPRSRHFGRLLRSLGAGLVVTLFLAWPLPCFLLYKGLISHHYSSRAGCNTPIGTASFKRSRLALSDAVQVVVQRPEYSWLPFATDQSIPYWAALPVRAEPNLYYIDTGASGWPMRCFASECWQYRGPPPGASPAAVAGGTWTEVLKHNKLLATTPNGRVFLPLRPIWPGLIVNIALYSAAFWLLLAMAASARRRRRCRRGLCAACGYDRAGTVREAPCPECGVVPPAAAAGSTHAV